MITIGTEVFNFSDELLGLLKGVTWPGVVLILGWKFITASKNSQAGKCLGSISKAFMGVWKSARDISATLDKMNEGLESDRSNRQDRHSEIVGLLERQSQEAGAR